MPLSILFFRISQTKLQHQYLLDIRQKKRELEKTSQRRQLDTLLDKLDDKELAIIEATANGLCKAKEPEE